MTDVNALSLSDEDFVNEMPPVVTPEAVVVEPTTPAIDAPAATPEPVVEPEAKVEEAVAEPKPADDSDDKVLENGPPPSEAEGVAQDKAGEVQEAGEADDKPVEGEAAAEPVAENNTINYEESYNKIVGSIKADGKTFEVKSPEEAIKLMQQGVHYGRKMQDLAKHKKIVMTLEANGVDDNELSYLIDLKNKNPEAIKKLIKDSGIDPLEFDANTETAYRVNNHLVSDEEVNFRTVMDDVKSTSTGQETLSVIHNTWDTASKDELWKDPEILRAIDEQRASGIYDRINSEVNRLKTLGELPQNLSVLQAYTQVGDKLAASGAFQDLVAQKPSVQEPTPAPARTVLETRADAPKPVVQNNARAAAAAASSNAPKVVAPLVNPLGMSDEEFLKQTPPR